MRRLALLLAISSVAVLAGGATAGADKAPKAKRSACQSLRGKDLAPARNVKLVRVRNESNERDLVGCVLPRGRIRSVERGIYSSSDTSSYWYRLLQVVDEIVLTSAGGGDQYSASQSICVTDLGDGRRYPIATETSWAGDPGPSKMPSPVIVSATGGAVAAFQDAQTVSIVGFSPTGRRQALATAPAGQIAPESLKLTGNAASWVQQGQPVTATLPT